MTHAQLILKGRKEHVKPAACLGNLSPFQTRRQWATGSVEKLFKCDDCGSILGLVGDTVEWSMSAANWRDLD